jgi:hypothetical protein
MENCYPIPAISTSRGKVPVFRLVAVTAYQSASAKPDLFKRPGGKKSRAAGM